MTSSEPFSVRNRVVVVTGGASGIGAALCKRFADDGAGTVVVVDMDVARARALAQTLGDGVGVAMGANCGVEMDLRRVIVTTEFEHGPIAVFVCNAGIACNGGLDVPDEEWSRIWRVNSLQQLYVARHLFPRWLERGGGHLVVTASAAGLLSEPAALDLRPPAQRRGGKGDPLYAIYARRL